jgi:hypothetical protein
VIASVVLLAATVVPIECAVVEGVVDDAWLDAQVLAANRIFEPAKLRFVRRPKRTLPAKHAHLVTRADRTALGDEMKPKVVNCFIVGTLMDIHTAGRPRQGVHWRPRGHKKTPRGAHYVIVAAYAGKTVLAHELGHFFGNRVHPKTKGNIMSYNRGDQPPFFDAGQLKKIGRFLRRFLRSGELAKQSETP